VGGSAARGATVVASLPRTGEAVTAPVDGGGAFGVRLAAAAGDIIRVFAVGAVGEASEQRALLVGPATACADPDGDGFGALGSDLAACAGSTTEPDCADDSGDARPGQTQFFTAPLAAGGFDYSCDGKEERQYPSPAECSGKCSGGGWQSSVPGCGQSAPWAECVFGKTGCVAQPQGTRVQGCR
jgi:hypothetical protein